ncbi:hypothetical protein MKK75_00290 [Methylobacterium sp. J-030]|uniref:hypothetical protein n=1 Tax=Methylobacterium sp. J-030 TaxID=2836627 RepID=UPI001FBA8080|nr:hypothetical protein [Methylobacterium sp. J-030]MCJ2067260.1 hypothetical protein [Methylobacterium sp. J-030]
MTGTLIPLRSDRGAASALAVFDVTAVELLQEGRAATLLGARLTAIKADLLAKRVQLIAVIADLQARPSSGDAGIDAVNVTLRAEAGKGLAHIDMFLRHTEACAASVVAS